MAEDFRGVPKDAATGVVVVVVSDHHEGGTRIYLRSSGISSRSDVVSTWVRQVGHDPLGYVVGLFCVIRGLCHSHDTTWK